MNQHPMNTRRIGEHGKRTGETQGPAKLTKGEADLIPDEQGKMEIGKRHLYRLIHCERRASVVAEYRWMKARN